MLISTQVISNYLKNWADLHYPSGINTTALGIMYKIQNQIAPQYLTNTCPPLTNERTQYNLRTGMNITIPPQRTTTYQNSFYPQSIKDWNSLPGEIRTATSTMNFKDKLESSLGLRTNKLYHHDSNKAAINQTRMRLGLSGLGSHRHEYKHIYNPKCQTCNARTEDLTHYFLLCPTYANPRPTFL